MSLVPIVLLFAMASVLIGTVVSMAFIAALAVRDTLISMKSQTLRHQIVELGKLLLSVAACAVVGVTSVTLLLLLNDLRQRLIL